MDRAEKRLQEHLLELLSKKVKIELEYNRDEKKQLMVGHPRYVFKQEIFWSCKDLYIKIEKQFPSGFMRRSEVLQTLTAHRNELAAFGIKSLAIFGSVARDEARPDSDVDILVEFLGPATFNAYMDLKFFLEELLKRPVDLVTRKSIRPRIKAQVESEAQYVEGLSALS